jgi:termination-of-autophagy Tag1-like protein
LPQLNITRLNFHDPDLPNSSEGMIADATISVQNDFPLNLILPSLDFDIRADNCLPSEPKIVLANATVESVHIYPKQDIVVNATGFVHQPSDSLTKTCPGSGKSPLDTLLGGYIRGHQVMLYISGAEKQPENAPKWISDLLHGFTLPVPFTGHAFGNVIKNFTLDGVKFDLPDPLADPDDPESNPQVSATIKAVITLPEEMNFQVAVQRVRAIADIYYKGSKLGDLNLRKWQPATSTRLNNTEGEPQLLLVESDVDKAPLNITNQDTFAEVVQALLFGGKPIMLEVKADVDVELDTALGILTVQEIPAEGKVPVKSGFFYTTSVSSSRKLIRSFA